MEVKTSSNKGGTAEADRGKAAFEQICKQPEPFLPHVRLNVSLSIGVKGQQALPHGKVNYSHLLRGRIQQELICLFEMAAVILSGNWAIFYKWAVPWLLCWSYSHVLFLYCVRSLPWLLALLYYLFIAVVSLFVLLISTCSLRVAGRVCPSLGESCSAGGARPPAAAPAPPHWSS